MSKKVAFGLIYEIRNTANNKRYVGSSVNLKERKANHFSLLRHGKHHSIVLQRAFDKYGEKSFFFAIIESNIPDALLLGREQYWLDKLQPEYNILRVAGSNKGWHHSDKTKASMSAKRKGRSPSLEWRQKISDVRKGYIVPLERRKRISESLKGHSYSVAKSIRQIHPHTNEVIRIWKSGRLAADELGISRGNLSMAVNGKRAMAGGFRWELVKDE